MSETNGQQQQKPPRHEQSRQSSFLPVLISGLVVRLYLLNASSLLAWLQNRVEIITPLNSWQRVLEGIYLKNRLTTAASSYQGDLVHELPMMLRIYEAVLSVTGPVMMKYLFVLADGLNAILIYSIATRIITYLIRLEKTNLQNGLYTRFLLSAAKSEPESKSAETFLLTPQSFPAHYWSLIVLAIYLFNPFTCAACLAQSTTTFQNSLLLLWLHFLLDGNYIISLFFLSWHANCTIYSVNLLPATINFVYQYSTYFNPRSNSTRLSMVLKYVIVFSLFTSAFIGVNFALEEFNWRFVECTYMFILRVPDLLPNLGLFWYFFTEIFDHFVLFFTYVFQLNAFIYTLPLAIRLADSPLFNLVVQLAVSTIFKSYPSVAETGLYLALVPCFVAYLFPLMRNFLVYSCMLLVAVVLAPVMFYLWVGSGGGNANFYFAITLVYSMAQIFLVIDIFHAHLKREFIKINGIDNPKDIKGSLARFSLD